MKATVGALSLDRPVLVTGATGFLGSNLVRALISHGVAVRATGRDLDKGQALARTGADFYPVDLCDRPAVIKSCQGVQAVIHSGAMVTAWGRPKDYWKVNVQGTENVIAGCLQHGVQRLVYISTPSVATREEPQLDISEQDPLPSVGISPYAETKRIGEERVGEAQRTAGLETVILRPKAIYGPGDNALLPKLLEAAQRGRLVRIRGCSPITNLTHIRDVVQACLLALSSRAAVGRAYYITGQEQVALWDLIDKLVSRLGFPRPEREISLGKARFLARLLTFLWRVLPLKGEPPLTLFTLSILAHSQTYDISAAQQDLGYSPEVPLEEGLEEVITAWQEAGPGEDPHWSSPGATAGPTRPGPEAGATVDCTLLNAGHCQVRQRLILDKGSWGKVRLPALFALIHHPEEGLTLFDTGYSPRFFSATRHLPYRLYRVATPVEVTWEEAAMAQLKAMSIEPSSVRRIIVSHFDPDHIGGLRDFPEARIVCSVEAWRSVAGKQGFEAMRARLLPGHLPGDIAARLELLDEPRHDPVGPFPSSIDLFGDGSIRLVSLPGHAPGQLGALLRLSKGQRWLLVADACWLRAAIVSQSHGLHRRLAHHRGLQEQTYHLLKTTLQEHPGWTIIPAHCPDAAAELLPLAPSKRRET